MSLHHPQKPWLHTPAVIHGIEIFEADALAITEALESIAALLGATPEQLRTQSLDLLLPALAPEFSGIGLSNSSSQSSGRWAFVSENSDSTGASYVFGFTLHNDVERLEPAAARSALRSKAPASALAAWIRLIQPTLDALGIEDRFGGGGPRSVVIWDGEE